MDDQDDDGYKHLGILELDYKEIKGKIITTYFKQLKLLLKSQYNSRNLEIAINISEVAVVHFSALVLNLTSADSNQRDCINRKTIKMYDTRDPRALHEEE